MIRKPPPPTPTPLLLDDSAGAETLPRLRSVRCGDEGGCKEGEEVAYG